MNNFSRIPFHLSDFQNKSAFFITYHGDIYFGSLWECPGYYDGFFIVRNDKLQEAISLQEGQKSPETFRELGWEIKDHRIIKQVLEGGTNFHQSPMKTVSFSGQQFTQMFVFGAAASTYCVFGEARERFRNADYNPPTGFEIFDEKYYACYGKYPGAKQAIPEFESRNKDIEGCLDDEWSAYKNSYSPDVAARHINIQFYLQELFQKLSEEVVSREYRYNLYNLFCKKLQAQLSSKPDQVAVIVSFNYDTILDQFIETFTSPFTTMENYFDWDNRNMVLFKPHGSANWGWKFKGGSFVNKDRFEFINQLYKKKIEPWKIYYELLGDISETVESRSWGLEGKYSLNKNLIKIISGKEFDSLYHPALLLPYRDKDEFVMPYQMQHAMTSCFNQVAELFLIGWKGNEDLFNQKLKNNANSLKKITIVNPRATDVKNNLEKVGFDLSRYEINEIETFEMFVLSCFS